ncbi:MAG: hypothetical protein RBG13Loki_0891 [Promethearchaeota archaeon CR_4]|nr:MAG: hypothetical protein RBG13Loki_0891 [Candidatus Lokiarchaeota archaeon CR_4]
MQTKRLIGIVMLSGLLLVLATAIYGNFVTAAVGTQEVPGNQYSGTHEAGTPVTYRFRERTQLRLNSSVNLSLNINCDADNIGEQTVEINIDADAPSSFTMNCTETQAELGLMKGETVQVRNRERNQVGFCVNLSLQGGNLTRAQLRYQVRNQTQAHVWAYYDEANAEWVEVPTTIVDGYAVAEVTHFSVWTVLTYEAGISGYAIILPVSAAAIVGLVLLQKRRRK